MKPAHLTEQRLLSIVPSSRGFGFAVLESKERLVDWGVKSASADKNAQSLAKAGQLIAQYQPDSLVLQDHTAKAVRCSPRIQELQRLLVTLAERHKINVRLLSTRQVKKALLSDGEGTKYDVATTIADKFPEELGSRLPPKRRLWKSEDERMHIFSAVALVLVATLNRQR